MQGFAPKGLYAEDTPVIAAPPATATPPPPISLEERREEHREHASAPPREQRPPIIPGSKNQGPVTLPWLKGVAALSTSEVTRYQEPLYRFLRQCWKYADETISSTTRDRTESHIWRTIDADDTQAIVSFLLRQGQQSAAAAQIVRGMATAWENYRVALILGPRVGQTVTHYAHHGFGIPGLERRGRRGIPTASAPGNPGNPGVPSAAPGPAPFVTNPFPLGLDGQ